MKTIINTVGISLINNAKKALKSEPAIFSEKTTEQSKTTSGVSNADLSLFLKKKDQSDSSAETNAIQRLAEEGDSLVFLHSCTPNGEQCAVALESFYKESGRFKTKIIAIDGLDYTSSSFRDRGLRSLIHLLSVQIQESRNSGNTPIINATGGFKAEIVYSSIVGLLFNVPVYYIHEEFKDLVELPSSPLSWDMGTILYYEDFFRWLNEDLRPANEVDQRAAGMPESLQVLIASEEEGYRTLSPLGTAFYESFIGKVQAAHSVPLLLSSKARNTWDGYSPSVRAQFERWLERIRVPELRRSQSERISGVEAIIFPQGHCQERIFVTEDAEGVLRILEFALHGSTYEKLLDRAKKSGLSAKDYDGFAPM